MKRKEIRYWLHNMDFLDSEIFDTLGRIETFEKLEGHDLLKVARLDVIPNNGGFSKGNEHVIVNRLDFIISLQKHLSKLLNLKNAITQIINSYKVLDEYRYQIIWHKYLNKIPTDKGYEKLTINKIAKLLYKDKDAIVDIDDKIVDKIITEYYKQKNNPQ